MELPIRIPEVGESIQEALLAEWFKGDGEAVEEGESLFLLETDKVTLEVPAEAAGVVQILVPAGSTVAIGDEVGKLRVDAAADATAAASAPTPAETPPGGEPEAHTAAAPKAPKDPEAKAETAVPKPADGREESAGVGPAVRRLLSEHDVDPAAISATGPGGRLTKGDVLLHLESRQPAAAVATAKPAPRVDPGETSTRKPLSPIRKRIAQRLLQAVQGTAMLTTFNEIDMGEVLALRKRHNAAFQERYGVKLGITSFFMKAVVEALKEFAPLNASIDGDDLVQHHHYHIGVAVGAERGLVVPVVRHADRLSFARIEEAIAGFVSRIRDNKLELSDLSGGTFTITNGGVFGSLLSTPILNYPQSGILGLHKVEPRPVVVDGEIVVRQMMYVALSYDHRVVDGREAVQFLARVKALVEDPERLLVEV